MRPAGLTTKEKCQRVWHWLQDASWDFCKCLTNRRIIEVDIGSFLLGTTWTAAVLGALLFIQIPVLACVWFLVCCITLKLIHGASDESIVMQHARLDSLVMLLRDMEQAADVMKGSAQDPRHPAWNVLQEGIQELKAQTVKRRHLLKQVEQDFSCRVQAICLGWFKRKDKQDAKAA